MTEFLDDLARTLAKPMPRRGALRVFGGAVVGIWAGGSAPSARAASRFHTCEKDGGLLCKCPNRDLFYQICCIPKDDYTCECKAPPNGYARCKPKCDDKCGDKCCKKGEYCASKPRSLCCREGEDACVVLGTPGTAEKGAGGKCCPRASTLLRERQAGVVLRPPANVLSRDVRLPER